MHLSLYFIEYDKVRSLAGSWFGGAGANIILVGFNIGFLVFTAFCAFMVLQLFVFHLGLKRENITTYQYILRDTAKKRERMRLSNMVMQRRVEELENAGNSMEAFCLKAGALQCCMPCDPVRRLVLQELDQAAENEEHGNDDRSYSVADDHQEDGSNGGSEMKIAGSVGVDEESNGVQEAANANGATSPSNNSTQSSRKSAGSRKSVGNVCADSELGEQKSEDGITPSGITFIKVTNHSENVLKQDLDTNTEYSSETENEVGSFRVGKGLGVTV